MTYNQFAYIYDKLMEDAPYDTWAAMTKKIIRDKGISESASILDLGCGTGEIAIRLSKYGYVVTGVDNSNEMLSVAQNKAIDEREKINWICQDMRDLQGFTEIDVCISYCDVMNYIVKESDIALTFNHVFASLRDYGLFIFDVHDDTYADESLVDHTFADVGEDVTYIWECAGGEKSGRLIHDLTFFQQTNANKYIKFEETHEQQVYPLALYEKLLKNAGFRKIEFFNDFQPENELSSKNRVRNFIIAEK